MTTQPDVARDWFSRFEGAGLDGVVVKAGDLQLPTRQAGDDEGEARAYRRLRGRWIPMAQGGRRGRVAPPRTLRRRTGCSITSGSPLDSVPPDGRSSSSTLEPYRKNALTAPPVADRGRTGRVAFPGARAAGVPGKDLSWEPLRPELVAEVSYDHLQGDRFRHATSFVRWRPDREPASCTYAQLDTPVPTELEGRLRHHGLTRSQPVGSAAARSASAGSRKCRHTSSNSSVGPCHCSDADAVEQRSDPHAGWPGP